MKYERLKKFLIATLFVFGVAGFIVNFLPEKEAYPFYSWNLFSKIPNNESSYYIRVTEYKGQKKNDLLIGEKLEEYIKIDYRGEFYWLIQDYGRVVEEKNAQETRMELESLFKDGNVSYQVVLMEYDPYKFKRFGEVIDEKVVGAFEID